MYNKSWFPIFQKKQSWPIGSMPFRGKAPYFPVLNKPPILDQGLKKWDLILPYMLINFLLGAVGIAVNIDAINCRSVLGQAAGKRGKFKCMRAKSNHCRATALPCFHWVRDGNYVPCAAKKLLDAARASQWANCDSELEPWSMPLNAENFMWESRKLLFCGTLWKTDQCRGSWPVLPKGPPSLWT